MSDIYLNDARIHLKIAELSLKERLKMIEARPPGMVLRRNQAAHTIAMQSLLEELMAIASHDPHVWWENEESVPF